VTDTCTDTCTWRGVNPEGGARQGRARYDPDSIAAITEAYYEDGWQYLTVWLGWDETGDVVARIRRDPETGRREWWAAPGTVPAEAEAAVLTQLEGQ
jgi:hypothetical protein